MSSRKKPPGTLRAVAYVRVSTDEQRIGPAAQIHAIEQWCSRHGVELVAEPFVDNGVSGGLDLEKRPALIGAVNAIKEHGANILVAHKRDRVARSVRVINNLMMLLRKMGCKICTTEQPPSDAEELDPMLEALEGMQDVFAQLERAMIRQRTTAALAVKKRRGERVGTIPYGFKLSADGRKLLPDPREKKLVQLVLKLRQDGKSLRAIAKELEARGYKPKSGKHWYASTVKAILDARERETR